MLLQPLCATARGLSHNRGGNRSGGCVQGTLSFAQPCMHWATPGEDFRHKAKGFSDRIPGLTVFF